MNRITVAYENKDGKVKTLFIYADNLDHFKQSCLKNGLKFLWATK